MSTLDHLAELMAAAPLPLSTKILATSGGMANEVLFQIGDVMEGGRSVQLPGNYSHLIVAALNALPALLETARIAGNYLAAVDALEFAMAPYTYDVEVDSDTARTDEWHAITRGALVLALAKLTPKGTT